jgi:1,4-dihydroxy-2-naphthoate octaprenyltransferase
MFVFVFFGLVATVGTFYVQTLRWDRPVVWLAAALVGLLATALLLANNLRDIATDGVAGKKTLVVRVGRRAGGYVYVACVVVPFVATTLWALGSLVSVGDPWRAAAALLPLLALPLVVAPVRTVVSDAAGRALLPVLAQTGRLQLVFGVLLAGSLWLWIR